MTSAVVAGSTGLVGSHILNTLLADPSVSAVHAFSRRTLSQSSPKLRVIQAGDPARDWPESFPANSTLFLSALAVTLAAAGSLQAQRAVDVGLNAALARSAKAAGVETYVLVSSGGANAGSYFPYLRIKGEVEEAVKEVGFDHLVILRPGQLRGRSGELRLVERAFGTAISIVGKIGGRAVADAMAQDADVVAKAAVAAGLRCVRGEREKGVWEVNHREILQLGRDEWKSPPTAAKN